MDPKMGKQYEDIDEFYNNAEILLTGATGFLGKLMIDKLLRSFPNTINRIYILIRDKKGVSPEERANKLFANPIFDKLHKELPNFKSKITVINGNIQEVHLGLSQEDTRLLYAKVNIIFHCAATLRFDEELRVAVRTNILATQKLLNLAKKCPHLRMFTYVSTAFSNANHRHIKEKIYRPSTHYTKLIELAMLEGNDIQYILATERIARENINTYTLTKAAAEQLISEESEGFPVSIFRPSIVISTWQDPIPGWIDNLYGPTGLVCATYAGVVRSIYGNPNGKADLVPGDLVVNALVCSAWFSCNEHSQDRTSIPIYNYVSSKENSITWYEFVNTCFNASQKMPSSKALWCVVVFLTKHRLVHMINCIFLHYLFGLLFDMCAWIIGNKMRLIPVYSQIDKVSKVLEPFSTQEWSFENTRVQKLWKSLSQNNRNKFFFNIGDIDWVQYLDVYIKGTLVFHLQDKLDPETRKNALKRNQRLKIIHQCFKSVMMAFSALVFSFLIKAIFRGVLNS